MRRKCIRYSPEVAEEVLARLRAGESLYRIEQDPRMPCSTTVMAWSRARPEFGAAVSRRCFELGLNVNIVQLPGMGGVMRMAPPLTIGAEDLDLGVEIIGRAVGDCLAEGAP